MKIILLLCLCIFAYSQNEINIDIVEGTQSLTIQASTTYELTLRAKADGTFVIIFPDIFQVIEATGDLNEDIRPGISSRVYAQRFAKGDYAKLKYPYLGGIKQTTINKIRIEKIEGNFRLMTTSMIEMFTMAMNDCNKPTYVFAYNRYPKGKSFSFYGLIHSGAFTGSYRTSEFDPDYQINKNFKEFTFTVNKGVTLANVYLNIVKLQCTEPGLISVYMASGGSEWPYGVQLSKNTCDGSCSISFSSDRLPFTLYIQRFSLVGSTYYDCTEIKGSKYYNNFCAKIDITSRLSQTTHYSVKYGKSGSSDYTMTLTFGNKGENTDKVLTENEKILVLNQRIIIPLKVVNDKNYIKLQSSMNGIFWEYQYSQTSDINYLPYMTTYSRHYEKKNVVYIDNPYKYSKIKTNYYWFVSFANPNEEGAFFSYEYTNEKEKEKEEEKEEEKEKEKEGEKEGEKEKGKEEDNYNQKSNSAWVLVIFIILIICGIAGAIIFYRIKKKNSTENVENLVYNLQNQNMS